MNAIIKAMTSQRKAPCWLFGWGYRLRLCFNCLMIVLFISVLYHAVRSYSFYYQATHLSPSDYGLPANTPHRYFPSPLPNLIIVVCMTGILAVMTVCNRKAWRNPDKKDSKYDHS
jgi:hypothetical protein